MKYTKFLTFVLFLFLIVSSVTALELSDIDFNNDNNIDINDIKELIPNFGKSSGFDAKFDVNSDGKIGIYDLVLVARRFGQTYEDSLLFCGNGVWDTGETLSNCPQDCTEYCNNPPDEITVLDTGEYIFGAYMMPGGYPGGTPPPPSSTYDQNRFEFIWNKIISNQPYLPGADQPIIPLLNPYDESNPIAIDWMIKWALEHGVSLFVYDWFWYDGQNWFDDMKSLEQGFMNSKYLDEYPMEFAVMWTNVYDSSYPEAIYDDRTRMMNYAIDNYFVHPNYLKIDGKPVFFIYRHDNIPASKYVRISSEKGEKISSQIIDREYVTDGIVDDLKYAAINSDQNNCIELNLGRVYNVSKIEIWHRKGRTYYASTVLVSADKTNWITISSNTQIIETEEGNVFEFDSVDIRYVRDCISGNRRNDQLGSPLDKRNFWVEIKVWSNGNNIAQNLALREQNELEHTLNTWRNMAINKGFNGIYFVTVSGMRPSQDPEFAQDIGMEGLTAYYYSNTSHTADNGVRYSSYGIVREYYKDKWAEQYAINNNYFPLITPCYDDTMKYRYNGKLITYCRPDRFHTQVNDAKQFVDQNNINPKIIMIKAWNEWPESSVLVPTESQQFGYLEAIKNTFS